MARKAKRLCVFNHKGGVGKTTLSINMAAAMAAMGKRVLLADTDPQCNLTTYVLDDAEIDKLLDQSDKPGGSSLWSAIRPVYHQEGPPALVKLFDSGIRNVSLLAGDIKLSEFEGFLGDQWTECFKRRIGAIKATCAVSALLDGLEAKNGIEYTFYDAGPNVGPLNRSILLDVDGFVVPVACDQFSTRALSTLGAKIREWIVDWKTVGVLAPDDTELLRGLPRFLGFVPQMFRMYNRTMASTPAHYLRVIQERIRRDVMDVLKVVDKGLIPDGPAKIGEVRNLGEIVHLAQTQGVAMWRVDGGADYQKSDAKNAFEAVAKEVIARLEG